MNRIIESLCTLKPIYVIFLLIGALMAVMMHFARKKVYERFGLITAIYVLSLCLALLLSTSLLVFFNNLIEKKNSETFYLSNFSFLFTSVLFVGLVFVFCEIFSLGFDGVKQEMTLCLLLFLFFAKLGCFFNGCCNSKHIGEMILHFSVYESIFAIILILLYFFKKINIFNLFFLIYLPYRLISEFFRYSYDKQIIILGLFTPTQIISSIAFVFFACLILIERGKAKNR